MKLGDRARIWRALLCMRTSGNFTLSFLATKVKRELRSLERLTFVPKMGPMNPSLRKKTFSEQLGVEFLLPLTRCPKSRHQL